MNFTELTNGLAKARKEYGLSLEFVSKRTDFSIKELQEIEQNNVIPNINFKLTKLAEFYGIKNSDDVFSCELETPNKTFIARNANKINDKDKNQIRKLYKIQALLG